MFFVALAFAIFLGAALAPGEAAAESDFWEEMAHPGITEYRRLVAEADRARRAGELGRAEQRLREATALRPEDGQAWALLALVLVGLDRADGATRAYGEAYRRNPTWANRPSIAIPLAEGLARLGRLAEARQIYSRLLSLGVARRYRLPLLVGLADVMLSERCDAAGDAIELYREALRDHPDEVGTRWRLLAALLLTDQRAEADNELSTLLRLDPQWEVLDRLSNHGVSPAVIHMLRALSWERLGHAQAADREWDDFFSVGGGEGCWAEVARAHRAHHSPRARGRSRHPGGAP